MKSKLYLAAAAMALLVPMAASAQFLGTNEEKTTSNAYPQNFWSAKPTKMTPYVAPNRPHWKLSEILASHKGQTDWVQPIVRNREQEADYISMGAGGKTKRQFFADDRMIFIVQSGAIRVTIEGTAPFTATKGFFVNVPFRHMYTLETTSSTPSLRFEVRAAGSPPLYALTETPDAYPGRTYVKVRGTPGPAKEDSNPLYVDYMKEFNGSEKAYGDKFVWDDHFTSNILRGKAAASVPPDTALGHFHVDFTEFWFIMEGKIGIKIEGMPYFTTEPGDIMNAAQGRWHRAGNDPGAPWSTRVPFNPRPPILHNFEPE